MRRRCTKSDAKTCHAVEGLRFLLVLIAIILCCIAKRSMRRTTYLNGEFAPVCLFAVLNVQVVRKLVDCMPVIVYRERSCRCWTGLRSQT